MQITIEQVRDIEAREAILADFMKRAKRNYLTPEDQAQLPSVTNDERCAVELFYWNEEKPAKYFLYISEKDRAATTWTGEKLGRVEFGREYRGNMGDTRQSVRVYGNNGVNYAGIYFKSAGEYARIKALKTTTTGKAV